MKYELYIFPPGDFAYEMVCHAVADTPFMTISKGDLINPRTWTSHWANALNNRIGDSCPNGPILRVIGVEHLIHQDQSSDDTNCHRHLIKVFTEALDDLEGSRP